jgi:hypothetical protein
MNVVFDIDGVLANSDWRAERIPNWEYFYEGIPEDKSFSEGICLLRSLYLTGNKITYVTGRPERTRSQTSDWLKRHFVQWYDSQRLYMRKDDDHRPSDVTKLEILKIIDADVVIEDEPKVVEALKNAGYSVLQVHWSRVPKMNQVLKSRKEYDLTSPSSPGTRVRVEDDPTKDVRNVDLRGRK